MLLTIIVLTILIKLFTVWALWLVARVDDSKVKTMNDLKALTMVDTVIVDWCGYRYGNVCFLWMTGRGGRKLVSKGKDLEGMEKGLLERILNSYENPSFVNIPTAIFGPPKELTYFDERLRMELHRRFGEYKKRRLEQ